MWLSRSCESVPPCGWLPSRAILEREGSVKMLDEKNAASARISERTSR